MKVALLGGAYTAHSVIAAAQRCVNLFPEQGPRTATSAGTHASDTGEPSTVAHYPTPGTRLLGTIGTGPIRGIRQCTTGGVYVVSGDTLYSVDVSNWTGTPLGTLTPGIKTPVSMQDNGLDMVVVDGTANGWTVNLAANTFAQIDGSDGVFVGADRVDYLDTFFILNKPNTPQFYISGSLATTFDPLDFANKEAYSDLLVTVVVAHRLVYLFGERTTEVWYNAGATDIGAGSFPFAAMQSQTFIDHGCAAKYSLAVYDNKVFWLTKDRQGQGIVMMAAGEAATRVSTFAIEAEIAGYSRISDAIGFCYQMSGHTYYVLAFPQADKTWSYDYTTGQWHEWLWIDSNGAEHRHRANCFWPVNDTLVVGDWQNGNLYALDQKVFTDNGQPIKRLRAFPHILNDGKRVFYRQLLADFETGWAPEMISGSDTRLLAQFTAADGTNLSSYISEVGGGWTAIGPANAQIVGDKVVGIGGDAIYQSAAAIFTPDLTLHYDVVPPVAGSVVTGNTLWAIGRAAGANTGYRVAVAADGTQYTLTLATLPSGASASVAMGTIASGFFTAWLLLRGTNITAQVQRSIDSMWLRTDGTWHVDPGTIAAQFTDATYALPGAIMIGGTWPAPPPPTGLSYTLETPLASDPNFPAGHTNSTNVHSFDFTRNWFYQVVSHSGTVGISITDLNTMAVLRTVTLNQMYAGTAFGSPPGTPIEQAIWDLSCGNGTDIYIQTSYAAGTGSGTFTHLTRVDPVTMKVTGDYFVSPNPPPPITCVCMNGGIGGAVNTTATHTVVAYFTNGNHGPEIFDGTGMAPIGFGFAAAPTYGNNPFYSALIPGQKHGDGSCDFLYLNADNGGGSGNIDIWRCNVSDSLTITGTKTGTVNILSVFTPSPNLAITQSNYDAAHDRIILWLTDNLAAATTLWIVSVNFDGSINWHTNLPGDQGLYYSRGQSVLTGTTLMVGASGSLKMLDTGTGAITYTGSILVAGGVQAGSFYRVWDASRQSYWTYTLGTSLFTRIDLPVPAGTALALDNLTATATPLQLEVNLISLRWSDDRGHSWSSPVTQPIGEAGEYRTSLQWQRLAYARDRVFEISWSVPMRTALQGAFVDVTLAQS